jgi:hypothetical protein
MSDKSKPICPNCLWPIAVNQDGTLREHKREGRRKGRRCGGSGKSART